MARADLSNISDGTEVRMLLASGRKLDAIAIGFTLKYQDGELTYWYFSDDEVEICHEGGEPFAARKSGERLDGEIVGVMLATVPWADLESIELA